MHPFRTAQGARFSCRADFSAGFVLNLDFLAEDKETVPFHVSIRRDESLIVVNRRDPAGWRREIRVPMEFEHRDVPVEILFTGGAARLSVDGRQIGYYDAFPRPDPGGRMMVRRGFPALGSIAFYRTDGWADPASIAVEIYDARAETHSGILLSDAFELMYFAAEPDKAASGSLQVEGTEDRFPAVMRTLPVRKPGRPAEQALVAVVPGRAWDGAAQTLSLALSGSDGAVLGTVAITRAEAVDRIERLAQNGALQSDDRATLQAIEHARHGRLLALLSPSGAAALMQGAERFGLATYLEAGDGAAAPASPVVLIDPERDPAEAAERFTAAMRLDPRQDPLALLVSVAADLPDAPSRAVMYRRLIEWFTLADRLDALLAHWAASGDPWPEPAGPGDLYTLCLQLPLDYARGRFEPVLEALRRLAPPSEAWLTTPTLGWIIERAAASAPAMNGQLPVDWERLEILRAAITLLENRAPDYWERTSCLRLIRGVVAMIRHAAELPEDMAKRLLWLVGKVYAMSPAFWGQVEEAERAGTLQLPAKMRVIHRAFDHLQQLIRDDAADNREGRTELARALDLFRQLGSQDMPRYRRELFGPLGVTDDDPAEGLAPLVAGLDPDEASLRALAFPGGDIALDDIQLAEAREGLKAAYGHQVPRHAFAPLMSDLRAEAAGLLAGDADPEGVAAFARRLPAIGSEYGRFMGIALPLALARGLLARGRAAECGPLFEAVTAMVDTLGELDQSDKAIRYAPAPRLALDALMRDFPQADGVAALAAKLQPYLRSSPKAPVDDRAADLSKRADPLQDTVLCLYTCQAYLETRVQAIRESWLPHLDQMGVPFLIFVGGGKGERIGDVVYLDAPDDYEGLPQKSLAMIRWVLEHTSFAHLVKVDDDCFIDPQAWFGDLAHRAVHYHGRPLYRVRGQMDRGWHQAKSRTLRGKHELDKSPEPSSYADGGSGYALSRVAMAALVEAADSPAGQELTNLSFMEDKLVGDLLSSKGIRVDGTDYRISVLRRTKPGGPLVAQWENGFLPFAGSGIKLAHLDGSEKMAEVQAGLAQPRPQQGKIWPSYQPARQGAQSNTLDLVSAPVKLQAVNRAEVAVVACLRNEMFMLPRFLEHYRALGVEGFLIADNGSDDGSFEYLAEQPDVALFAVDTPYNQSRYGVAWQQALIANFRAGRWSLMADADELLFWNTDLTGDLPKLVNSSEFITANAARIFMLDMYPQGSLAEADFERDTPFRQAGFVDRDPFLTVSGARGPYSDSPIWTSALRHRLIPGSRAELFVAQKYALLRYRPWMRLSAGLHFVSDVRLARRELFFAHFKYNAQFRAKAQAEVARRQHFNNAEEYRKYLALVSEGRDVIHDPAVSVRWDEAEFVRRVCAGRVLSR